VLILTQGIDEESGEVIPRNEIAKILDGQHRIEGLKNLSKPPFDLPVSIFVNADMADQSYVFATVNLAQTKVNRSLVYDLLDYSTARSPQKSCHDIAVALDRSKKSPFFKNIKRLGTATRGRTGETLAQATFVGSLLPMISTNPMDDRDLLARGKKVKFVESEYSKTPLRGLWVEERESDIARMLIYYFSAVSDKWPDAWISRERGNILPRTNGYRALMRFFKNVYVNRRPKWDESRAVISKSEFETIIGRIGLEDDDFNNELFPPGSSGEKRLYDRLRDESKV
jgi:DGQHR domain-containing protein